VLLVLGKRVLLAHTLHVEIAQPEHRFAEG
jgi:hypothetical protein